MKKYIIYSLIITLTCGLGACNNDEDVDKANSIFSTEEVERSPFDNWILGNYTHPYNIALKYRMEDNESDMTHVLAPADYKKSVVLAKIIKHVWLEAYDEATGNPDFLRQYIPKTIHFIGSPAYEDNGTMVLGTAEGGMKITLYNVNDINPDKIDINLLNEYYFQTMHHEFAHILHQRRFCVRHHSANAFACTRVDDELAFHAAHVFSRVLHFAQRLVQQVKVACYFRAALNGPLVKQRI